jgi:hypothetical protein
MFPNGWPGGARLLLRLVAGILFIHDGVAALVGTSRLQTIVLQSVVVGAGSRNKSVVNELCFHSGSQLPGSRIIGMWEDKGSDAYVSAFMSVTEVPYQAESSLPERRGPTTDNPSSDLPPRS